MTTATATSIADKLNEQVSAIVDATRGVSDEQARKRPSDGEWSIAENVSHLCGEDARAFLTTVKRFAEEDVPTIEVTPGISFFESRAAAPIAELVSSFRTQYDAIGAYLKGLDETQLKRTAHVPLFKDTPFGDHPTVEQFVTVISDFHLNGHVAQVQAAKAAIGA